MRFTELNLFGVYVAPISVMLLAAWVMLVGLAAPDRHAISACLRDIWHPALFTFSVYTIVLSFLVLLVAR
ncbi:MAG: DUF1656 domain-containing protein [Rhodospirillales bacterium]